MPYSKNYDWETPDEFFLLLNSLFRFTLDPCYLPATAKCPTFFTPAENGLVQSWRGHRVYMNPPYGRLIGKWVKKAFYEGNQPGTLVVCLVPSRTDTAWWEKYCQRGVVGFIHGRLRFAGLNRQGQRVKLRATFPSAVIIFGAFNRDLLAPLRRHISFVQYLE